jgi:hypothetical protein
MGFQVNDKNMSQALSTDARLRIRDFNSTDNPFDGYYSWGGYWTSVAYDGSDRVIWDTNNDSILNAGDIDLQEQKVINATNDPDLGDALISDSAVMWFDNNGNGVADLGERAYYDNDASGTINQGDFYLWFETTYYGMCYDVEIHSHPTGASYQFVITVTATGPATDLDLTNNEFVYSPIFSDP